MAGALSQQCEKDDESNGNEKSNVFESRNVLAIWSKFTGVKRKKVKLNWLDVLMRLHGGESSFNCIWWREVNDNRDMSCAFHLSGGRFEMGQQLQDHSEDRWPCINCICITGRPEQWEEEEAIAREIHIDYGIHIEGERVREKSASNERECIYLCSGGWTREKWWKTSKLA